MAAKGRTNGIQGGTLRTLVSRSKDIRQMVVYGYARLVGYAPDYSLQPDILRAVRRENQTRRVAIHCVSIGMESELLRLLAAANGGRYVRR